MKKRAIISTVASVALAGVMCVGFAACGGNSAKDIAGEEVTKEVWNAAFESVLETKNFKLEVEGETAMEMTVGTDTIKITMEKSSESIYADSKTYTKDNTKTSISGDIPDAMKDQYKEGSLDTEYYVEETADATKYIAKVDGNWAYVENSEHRYATAPESLEGLAYVIGSTEYDDYVYSTEHKGYVEEEGEEGNLVVIKFQDGKLKAVYIEQTGEEGGAKITMIGSYVITYDGQSVDLPTIA